MSFGDRLREAREAAKLTQTAAAARVGQSSTNWSAWEAGRRVPSQARQAALLAAMAAPAEPVRGDYRDGALWALALMHETLAQAYRQLAAPHPDAEAVAEADAAIPPETAADAPPSPRRRRQGARPAPP
jgi:transcriptional regulator with XRE-family HTH domain